MGINGGTAIQKYLAIKASAQGCISWHKKHGEKEGKEEKGRKQEGEEVATSLYVLFDIQTFLLFCQCYKVVWDGPMSTLCAVHFVCVVLSLYHVYQHEV